MMKAGAIGQLYDVTELLQTQRRDSQWHMQEFVNGRAFPPFRGAHKDKGPEYYPMEFFCNQPRRSRRKKLPRRRRRKKCDASTSQSNDFSVSRKRFTPSTPGSIAIMKHGVRCLHSTCRRRFRWLHVVAFSAAQVAAVSLS